MKNAFSLVLITVFCLASLGASPASTAPRLKAPVEITVNAPKKVSVGDAVVLALEGVEDSRVAWIADGVDYKITDKQRDIIDTQGDKIEFRSIPANSLVFHAASPGKFTFICLVIPNDQTKPIQQTRHVVEVTGEIKPEPIDDDDPPKPIDDEKLADSEWLVLVEESSERTPEIAKIVNSKFWLNELKKRIIHDQDSDQGQAFIRRSGRSKVPFFAVMDEQGEFVRSFDVPNTVEDLREVIGR
jgi:hypothetical protein